MRLRLAGLSMKVRARMVDGRTEEYFMGSAHDITDRLFVVGRASRVNDSLPEDPTPGWQWQRGGWRVVGRLTGRVSAITLPEFDSLCASASGYQDDVAYCGIADDEKIDAVVSQVERRKPVIRTLLSGNGLPDDAAAVLRMCSPSVAARPDARQL
jgi:hypothetical protein